MKIKMFAVKDVTPGEDGYVTACTVPCAEVVAEDMGYGPVDPDWIGYDEGGECEGCGKVEGETRT